MDEITTETLKFIISATLMNPDSPKVEELRSLISMLNMSTEKVDVVIQQLTAFLSVSDTNKVYADVLSIISSSIMDVKQSKDASFIVDLSYTNSIIANACMKTLLNFVFNPEVQERIKRTGGECFRWAYRRKWDDTRKYAFIYWIFHLGESAESLGENDLELLEKLLSDRLTLGSLIRFDSQAVDVFLRLFYALPVGQSQYSP